MILINFRMVRVCVCVCVCVFECVCVCVCVCACEVNKIVSMNSESWEIEVSKQIK